METATVTLSVRQLLVVEELVRKLQSTPDEGKDIRGGLRAIGFPIEDVKGRGGPPYSLELLQADITSGKIAIRIE